MDFISVNTASVLMGDIGIHVGASPGPDWAAQATAYGTVALALFTAALVGGVFVAARQLWQDRYFNQVKKTADLIKKWDRDRYWNARSRMDKWNDLERNRQRVWRQFQLLPKLRKRIFSNKKRKQKFQRIEIDATNFISETSKLAEQMEIYAARGILNMDILANHIGYDIISSYYFLQDVLAYKSLNEDEGHEGFRDLALRVQHYARLNDVDIRDSLVWTVLPPLEYAGGDESEGYSMSRILRWRLKLARKKFIKALTD